MPPNVYTDEIGNPGYLSPSDGRHIIAVVDKRRTWPLQLHQSHLKNHHGGYPKICSPYAIFHIIIYCT